MTGQPAVFRFFASEVRSGDTPGQIIPNAESELEETSQLEVDAAADRGHSPRASPCRFRSTRSSPNSATSNCG